MINSVTPTGEGAGAAIILVLAFVFLVLPGHYKLAVIGAILLIMAFLNLANEEFGPVSLVMVLIGFPLVIFGLGMALHGADPLSVLTFADTTIVFRQTDIIPAMLVTLGIGALWFKDFINWLRSLFRK